MLSLKSQRVFPKFAFALFCYVTNDLMTGPLVNFVSLESQCFPPLRLGNIEIRGKQNSLFPKGPVIKCSLFLHRTFQK